MGTKVAELESIVANAGYEIEVSADSTKTKILLRQKDGRNRFSSEYASGYISAHNRYHYALTAAVTLLESYLKRLG